MPKLSCTPKFANIKLPSAINNWHLNRVVKALHPRDPRGVYAFPFFANTLEK